MTPEQEARQDIDERLQAAGWLVQDRNQMNLGASPGVAVREFPVQGGEADYLLFVDRTAVGVVEAKPAGTTLSGVAEQSAMYASSLPSQIPHAGDPLPFTYESNGEEVQFVDLRDPDACSRRVFSFHRPETLQDWLKQSGPLRGRLRQLPTLVKANLRECQFEAITNLEQSLATNHARSLIQMATGSGKTYTAVSFIYRLIKFGGARRVLFLVDRSNLARQTKREFEQYVTPDDGRKFTELYNLQQMTSNTLDPVSKVCITTIQRLFSMLKGDEAFDESLEEESAFFAGALDEKPRTVEYNPKIPIETFDVIVTDECHRSIYNLWRQVLEYFDAFTIGLTATPSKQTIGFFENNLVMEYSHERAVADGVNVGFEVYRVKTRITEQGSSVDAGFFVDKRDKLTRKTRWEQLDEELVYEANQLDRLVVSQDQIRTVIRTFRDKLFTDLFPGRTEVPKTLIFAKDDSHAEDIVNVVRKEFGKGNDFAKKITYRTTGEKPEDLLAAFRNSYNPRIAVTVDMISTGTDIKPLECLLFMRDVKSRVYFDQMKGRGTRTISDTDLQAVTPDAAHKTHFVIVDAVGVCETVKTDTKPLEKKRSVPFEKLLEGVAMGVRDEETLSSLAGRLARLDRELTKGDRAELEEKAAVPFRTIVNRLLDAIDPDVVAARAVAEAGGTALPTAEQVAEVEKKLVQEACQPFDDPHVRSLLVAVKKKSEQIIDTTSIDEVLSAEFDEAAKLKAQTVVQGFRQFIEDNKDELEALRILYSQPFAHRHLTFKAVRDLASALEKPPYHLAPEVVWKAYEQLEKSKVHRAGPQKLLTNIISLVRFSLGHVHVLAPYPEVVEEQFQNWLAQHEAGKGKFTDEQREWLAMIKDHIATSLAIEADDFDDVPFIHRGGRLRVHEVFGGSLDGIMQELNEVLVG